VVIEPGGGDMLPCFVPAQRCKRRKEKVFSFQKIVNPPRRLIPVHVRHADIQQHQMGLEFRDDCEGGFAAVSNTNICAQTLQQRSIAVSNGLIVVYFQDASFRNEFRKHKLLFC